MFDLSPLHLLFFIMVTKIMSTQYWDNSHLKVVHTGSWIVHCVPKEAQPLYKQSQGTLGRLVWI